MLYNPSSRTAPAMPIDTLIQKSKLSSIWLTSSPLPGRQCSNAPSCSRTGPPMTLVSRTAVNVPPTSLNGRIRPAISSAASKLMEIRLAGRMPSTLDVKSTNGIGRIMMGLARNSPVTTGTRT